MEQTPIFNNNNFEPSLIKDALILSPGIWNGTTYTSEEIHKAFSSTDWTNKSNTHLYLDHQDTQNKGVSNWVGFIKNPYMKEDALYGDLEIWNPLLSTYLEKAKAKFGVSATLAGLELDKSMKNFSYESFSVVTSPGCREAYINLSQDEGKIVTVNCYEKKEVNENSKLDNYKEVKEMESKKLLEEEKVEEVKEEKVEESVEEKVEEKVEESAKEVKEESAEAPKEEAKEESAEAPKEDELAKKVEALGSEVKELSVLIKKAFEKDAGLEGVKKELEELKEDFMSPNRKTLSISAASEGTNSSIDANMGMLGFLQSLID